MLSPAWRGRWARTEPTRLVGEAARALVDRTSINWTFLQTRLRSARDRSLVRNLRAIAAIRESSRRSCVAPELRGRFAALLWMLIAIALAHVLAALTFAAAAAANGPPLGHVRLQLLLAIAYSLPIAVLARGAPRDARRVFLMGAFVCAGSAFARPAITGLCEPLPVVANVLRGIWPEVFAPAFLWRFALAFPRVSRFTWFDRAARRVTVAMWTAAAAVSVVTLAVAYLGVDEGPFRAVLPNQPSNLFWRIFTIAEVLGLAAILLRAGRAPLAERGRVIRLAQVLAVCAVPFLTVGIVRTMAPEVDRWLRSAPLHERFWLDAVVIGGLAALPILACAAIAIDRPFELHRSLKHTWRRALDWRSGVASHERLGAALQELRVARGRREVVEILTHAAADLLGASSVRVLLPAASGDYADARRTTMLPQGGAVLALLRSSTQPLRLASSGRLFALLPHGDREWLLANCVELAAPIVRRDSTIAAILVAGRARAEHRQSGWRIAALAAAAATAWDVDTADLAGSRTPGMVDAERAFECPACGVVQAALPLSCTCNATAVLAALPHRLGSRLTVERRIGSGGMGIVYTGQDLRLGRSVAFKTLPRLDRENIERLRAEARVMASLAHDAVATLYDLEVWRDTPVLVMEHFPAGTLAARLRHHGALPLERALRIGARLAHAVAYMHGQGLLHRDIKPSNIALSHDGSPKLLDFGLGTLSNAVYRGRTARVPGTLAYLPPEALLGTAPAPAFDLWALAVVIVECIAGVAPLTADGTCSQDRAVAVLAGAGSPAVDFAARALALDSRARYQTGGELAAALEALIERTGYNRR